MRTQKKDDQIVNEAKGSSLTPLAGSGFGNDPKLNYAANHYVCLDCERAKKAHEVVWVVVGHDFYGAAEKSRKCTTCGQLEKQRWIPAGW